MNEIVERRTICDIGENIELLAISSDKTEGDFKSDGNWETENSECVEGIRDPSTGETIQSGFQLSVH